MQELFDLTMQQAVAFLEKRVREADLIFGIDPRRTKRTPVMSDVFRRAGEHGIDRLSDFVDHVLTRERARQFIDRAGISLDALKATLVEIDSVWAEAHPGWNRQKRTGPAILATIANP